MSEKARKINFICLVLRVMSCHARSCMHIIIHAQTELTAEIRGSARVQQGAPEQKQTLLSN